MGFSKNEHVLGVGAIFASGFIRALKFLEKYWNPLCHDIRNGTIDPEITDSFVREAYLFNYILNL